MSPFYIFSEKLEKLNLKSSVVFTALDNAIGLGWDYLRLCGYCENLELCLILSVSPLSPQNYLVDIVGLYVNVGENKQIDQKIASLFKHANYIVKQGCKVLFYVKRERLIGVYYILFSSGEVNWTNYDYPSSEELEYVSEEEHYD
jgi:hypothetical protein